MTTKIVKVLHSKTDSFLSIHPGNLVAIQYHNTSIIGKITATREDQRGRGVWLGVKIEIK